MKTTVIVSGNRASVLESPLITSGTVGMVVQFEFDDQWQQLEKIAVFKAGHIIIDQIIDGNQSIIPWEVLTKPNRNLDVGIYGTNDEGTIVIPTVWVSLGRIQPGADPSGDPAIDPTIPFWRQISKNSVFYTKQEGKTEEEKSIARANIGAAPAQPKADEKYFDITADGLVSLKPEHQADGDLNSELPEVLIIPDVVNDIAVTELSKSMFSRNERVRSLTIPSTITTIPRTFLNYAINLTELKGTENIEIIDQAAFQACGIKKALFPKLKQFEGAGQFHRAANLSIVDIGDVVTSIPSKCFAHCDRLSLVRGGESLTNIGQEAFYNTRTLKNLPIVSNAKSIGASAFVLSRVNYDWWALKTALGSDAFGSNATAAQFNPSDWWSGRTPYACKNSLGSTFHQRNPLWASTQIENNDETYGDGGCLEVSVAHIYSALGGKNVDGEDLKSPVEFFDVIREIDESLLVPYVAPDSGKKSYTFGNAKPWFDALGYDCELLTGGHSATNLKNIYDALAAGGLILSWINPGHAGVIFGVAENGEVLVLDSDSANYVLDDFTPRIYQQPIWTLVLAGQDVMTVKKK